MSGQSSALGEGDTDNDTDALGERDELGDELLEGLIEADGLLLTEEEGEELALGESEEDGEIDKLIDIDADGDLEELGLVLALGDNEALRDAEGEREELGEREADADTDTDADGEREELGDNDDDGDWLAEATAVLPGASPNQSTPGLGPGIPSSYRNMLSASSRAFLGNRDLSIRVITPRLKLSRVRNSGSGNCFLRLFSIVRGIASYPS